MNNEHFFSSPVLVLMAKRPRLGYGKQRLAAELGAVATLEIAEGLLACALEDLAAWPGPVVIAPSQMQDRPWAESLLTRALTVVDQGEGNLGQRLQRVDRCLRQQGAQRMLYMGSDSPTIQPHHFQAAARALEEVDVVLSAADDGGVVLMGAAKPWPPLAGLPWSTPELGEALNNRCVQAGLQCRYMAPGYDIDVTADLRRLVDDLAGDPRPARQQLHGHLLQLLSPRGDATELPAQKV